MLTELHIHKLGSYTKNALIMVENELYKYGTRSPINKKLSDVTGLNKVEISVLISLFVNHHCHIWIDSILDIFTKHVNSICSSTSFTYLAYDSNKVHRNYNPINKRWKIYKENHNITWSTCKQCSEIITYLE